LEAPEPKGSQVNNRALLGHVKALAHILKVAAQFLNSLLKVLLEILKQVLLRALFREIESIYIGVSQHTTAANQAFCASHHELEVNPTVLAAPTAVCGDEGLCICTQGGF